MCLQDRWTSCVSFVGWVHVVHVGCMYVCMCVMCLMCVWLMCIIESPCTAPLESSSTNPEVQGGKIYKS